MDTPSLFFRERVYISTSSLVGSCWEGPRRIGALLGIREWNADLSRHELPVREESWARSFQNKSVDMKQATARQKSHFMTWVVLGRGCNLVIPGVEGV